MSPTGRRTRALNDQAVPARKSCVLYVMSRDQRLRDNFALQAAQGQALQLGVPLAVVFVLYPPSGRRAREHYTFMLAGLRQLEAGLARCNIPLMLLVGDGRQCLEGVLHHLRPQTLVFDFSPLRGPQALHRAIAATADCPVLEADTHNTVPAWQVSGHQEYAARTLRPKLQRLLPDYLDEAAPLRRHPYAWPGMVKTLADLQARIDRILTAAPANGTDISRFEPGEPAAQAAVKTFVSQRLRGYAIRRNDPADDGQSGLSPYVHFGQLSAATAVRAAMAAAGAEPALQPDAEAFIEETTVRKELADNFCFYNQAYDRLDGAPEWARRTLQKHRDDPRGFTYARQQFEQAQTHDEAWNAAQRQLTRTGKMHGYMRMYWAKKVLEWSPTPQDALEALLYLNDFYHIDGGDPNGYVGILWSVAGLHDRPWGERPVYGTVRSMVYNGLRRKFDVQAYIGRYS